MLSFDSLPQEGSPYHSDNVAAEASSAVGVLAVALLSHPPPAAGAEAEEVLLLHGVAEAIVVVGSAVTLVEGGRVVAEDIAVLKMK